MFARRIARMTPFLLVPLLLSLLQLETIDQSRMAHAASFIPVQNHGADRGIETIQTNALGDALNVEFVSQIGGVTEAVAVQDNYAYVGEGFRMTILDITNRASPQVISKTPLMSSRIQDIAIGGNYAYIVAGNAGLVIFDISHKSSPVEVGSFDTNEGYAQGVAVSGSTAYVADGAGGLRTFNVTDPAEPQQIGQLRWDRIYSTKVHIAGSTAYLVNQTNFVTVDVTDPAAPKYLDHYSDIWENPNDVVVDDNYAFVTIGHEGLNIFNISDPRNLDKVATFATGGYANGIAISGSQVLVADGEAGLYVINVSDPTNPKEFGRYDTPGFARDVAASGFFAFVADGEGGGVHIINIFDTNSSSFYDTPGMAFGIASVEDKAYVVGDGGMRVIDASNPAEPDIIGFYELSARAHDVVVVRNIAYILVNTKGLQIIDITNPAEPIDVGFFGIGEYATCIAIENELAFISVNGGDGQGGIYILNISNSAQPEKVTFFRTAGTASCVAVQEKFAYVTTSNVYANSLTIINIEEPARPFETGISETRDYPRGIVVDGDFAYVADSEAGLTIFNIADPAHPFEVGSAETFGLAQNVVLAEKYAYVADGGNGLRIFDVSEPAQPMEIAFFETNGSFQNVAVTGNSIYTADWFGGLFILRPSAGSITIEKQMNPPGSTTFGFTGDLGDFTLGSGDSHLFDGLAAGDYVINETASIGWELDQITCDNEDGIAAADTFTIGLGIAQDVRCTFHNHRLSVTADAGGPYSGYTNSPIPLDGSGTSNQDMVKHYIWDCESNGSDDEISSSPTGSACSYGEPGLYTALLQTSDIFGQTSVDVAEVTIREQIIMLPVLVR